MAANRFQDNMIGQVFSPNLTLIQINELSDNIAAMKAGKLKERAVAALSAKDYALAAAWEADSHKPAFAQPAL